ncbi:hypothetical protein [Emticicia sp. BO119]|uniref:hypothetical protein n=1 Tax=Emticicia sp. BO119 TaxID=2757768 RepID=UPI0015F0F84A|nr:hypothetical protein [Emticicia sp. BO119]MBA4853750.1 hypothetical protein [Emticicia sp. BO119]
MPDKEKDQPSFPEGYEQFNDEMAHDIQQLRHYQHALEQTNQDLAKAHQDLKKHSPWSSDYNNRAAVLKNLEDLQKFQQGEVNRFTAKTYGALDRMMNEVQEVPEVREQVMQVLDEKVNPEKYENNTPYEKQNQESKEIPEDKLETETRESIKEKADLFAENRNNIRAGISADKTDKPKDYKLPFLQKKKEEMQQYKTELAEKKNETEKTPTPDKNQIPNAGYLNYQLKFQKPVSKEQSKEKLVKDFSKNNKDISPDKD